VLSRKENIVRICIILLNYMAQASAQVVQPVVSLNLMPVLGVVKDRHLVRFLSVG
jgi:hypothetical protein